MTDLCRLSVVIAVQYAQDNLPAILRHLDPSAHPDVEFLFCATDADPDTAALVRGYANTAVITAAPGSLIPQLWRDGIRAASAPRVALGTAHCIPAPDWVEQLLAADTSAVPGIGGVIENDPAATPRDWAVYLLRYSAYAPPAGGAAALREVAEIAADNALYRRADIMAQADLLDEGFWEPSFHARFRAAGQRLLLCPALRVLHRNRYSSGQFFAQRLAHGRAFGLARAREIGTARRLLLIVLSPLLPLLFLKKIVSAVMRQGEYRSQLLPALPWLLLFLTAWGLGEAQGYLAVRPQRVRPAH